MDQGVPPLTGLFPRDLYEPKPTWAEAGGVAGPSQNRLGTFPTAGPAPRVSCGRYPLNLDPNLLLTMYADHDEGVEYTWRAAVGRPATGRSRHHYRQPRDYHREGASAWDCAATCLTTATPSAHHIRSQPARQTGGTRPAETPPPDVHQQQHHQRASQSKSCSPPVLSSQHAKQQELSKRDATSSLLRKHSTTTCRVFFTIHR